MQYSSRCRVVNLYWWRFVQRVFSFFWRKLDRPFRACCSPSIWSWTWALPALRKVQPSPWRFPKPLYRFMHLQFLLDSIRASRRAPRRWKGRRRPQGWAGNLFEVFITFRCRFLIWGFGSWNDQTITSSRLNHWDQTISPRLAVTAVTDPIRNILLLERSKRTSLVLLVPIKSFAC